MSTQTPKSDDLKGKIIPFPITSLPEHREPDPAKDQEGNPISEGKCQVLVLRKKRIRRTSSILPIPYSKFIRQYLADQKETK